jgi:hypothetical protein
MNHFFSSIIAIEEAEKRVPSYSEFTLEKQPSVEEVAITTKGLTASSSISKDKDPYVCVKELVPAHPGSVRCLIVFGEQVWAGCGEGTIRIWNLEVKTLF